MKTNAGAMPALSSAAYAPGREIPRSTFDKSHGLQTAFSSGYLVPHFVEELLPGDTIQISETAFGRLTTQVVPVLHPIYLETFWFAVPVRLLWTNWEKFHGAQDNPDEVITEFEVPEVTVPASTGFDFESLFDYLGIPPGVEHDRVCAFYSRAYNLIWNEWFRDQDLQDKVVVDRGDGPDDPADYVLLRRGKRKDYLTAARPWPQKGDAITLPLGTSAPVTGNVVSTGAAINLSSLNYPAVDKTLSTGTGTAVSINSSFATSSGSLIFGTNTGLELDGATANLSAATSATINQLREAFSLQAVLEIDARSGSRYVEGLKAHFGVHPPDFRLMRPELIGANRATVSINPVASTLTATLSADPQYLGDLGSYGTVFGQGRPITYSAVEHMVVIGLANIRADIVYQQGLHRRFSRVDRYDYYLPSLAHLGEQAVLNKEIYADGTAADDEVWGYMPRWDELRFGQSRVSGHLRSTSPASLDVWQLALHFTSRPALDEVFIQDDPPFQRVTAVENVPDIRAHFWFNVRHTMPLPTFSVPGLVGPL